MGNCATESYIVKKKKKNVPNARQQSEHDKALEEVPGVHHDHM